MKLGYKFLVVTITLLCTIICVNWVTGKENNSFILPPYSIFPFVENIDTGDLIYPLETDPYDPNAPENPFDLENNAIEQNIEYNPETGEYIIHNTIGGDELGTPNYFSTDEYIQMQDDQSISDYWQSLSNSNSTYNNSGIGGVGQWLEGQTGISPKLPKLDDGCGFLGCGGIDIRPTGGIDLEFGFQSNKTDNPYFSERVRRLQSQPQFLFDMNINMSVVGKIGDRINLSTTYNTKTTFDFENKLELKYVGDEDHIIQAIEAGNINFELPTQLIPSVQNLFGLKTKAQFGRLTLTGVVSQQRSKAETIKIEQGAQIQEFEIYADEYQENRHFFLAHYFREHFNENMSHLPVINNKIQIRRMQVWVTNRENETEQARDVIAFMDLGEPNPYNSNIQATTLGQNPDNNANDLYAQLKSSETYRRNDEVIPQLLMDGLEDIQDFRLTQARMLQSNEYTFDPKLGFLSINTPLQDQDIIGVAFEYDDLSTGKSYQVGEMTESIVVDSTGTDRVLFLKMLKSTDIRPNLPIWDLMMKNIYPLQAFQITQEDFRLDIYYKTPGGGLSRFLPNTQSVKDKTLLQLMGLDRLNHQLDPVATGDGIFDFVEGYTIVARNGRLIFPVLEPFGEDLREQFDENEEELASFYAFDSLYVNTKQAVLQYPEKNRFIIKGQYKSSTSNEYQLGAFNIPRNSIVVSAGGKILTEGVDYDVNYGLGRVTITNDAYIESAVPINIRFEDPSLFSIQQKTMMGIRADYWINDDFTLGATYMRLSQKPYTRKTNYGDDAINNRILGVDMSYFKDAPFLTRLVDKIPGIETKEPSSIAISGEAAKLIPGHARAIDGGSNGVVFIDDFEGAQSVNFLDQPFQNWALSSTPRRFPEYSLVNDYDYGKNRAKLAWYRLDQDFYDANNHYARRVAITEVFPNTDVDFNITGTNLFTLDLSFSPTERGPYNFDVDGLNVDGTLQNPEERWGGISRSLINTNFEKQNYEFIEFWLMDPFLYDTDNSGELYFNLGRISEDVLRDGKRFFENGLPRPGGPQNVDTTKWARVPLTTVISNAFDSDENNRKAQDVGFDGVDNDGERELFADYLDQLEGVALSPEVKEAIINDPSNDDYVYYNSDIYTSADDIVTRYKKFNNPDGNADVSGAQVATSSNPDTEDLNSDNLLEQSESYYEYKIELGPNMDENHPYVADVVNGSTVDGIPSRWLHFKIPIKNPTENVGGIEGFRSIQFARMYLTNFKSDVICRFARLGLVRNVWRKYEEEIVEPGEYFPNDNSEETVFNVGAVSIEQSGGRSPIPYVLPPQTIRELSPGTTGVQTQQNEQALSVELCNLQDGAARAVFKSEKLDVRQFKRLQMWLHAEEGLNADHAHQDGDVAAIIRLGDDFNQNYYEYEIPLALTAWGATSQDDIWPDANRVDIELQDLVDVKKKRNYSDLDFDDYTKHYTEYLEDGRKITVVGSPDLGDIKNIMLGVRNPKRKASNQDTDDGLAKCVEVWFNEMALADFNEQGGWGALARVDMKLADFGDVTVSGNMHTAGFGTIEQQVNDRYQDNLYESDVIGNFKLDRFLPKSANMQIPLQVGYTRSVSNPQYDPYNTDIKMEEKLDSIRLYSGEQAAKEAKKEAQDFTATKSINLTGVKKLRDPKSKKKPMPWDIENVTLGYSYTEIDERDPVIEVQNEKQHKATLDYSFTTKPKYITPFKKKIKSSKKYLQIIRDFNFNLIPKSFGFRTSVNRMYETLKLRSFESDGYQFPTSYNKDFVWARNYNLDYDLAKSLGVKFTATNEARIDEEAGKIDRDARRELMKEFWTGGRNLRYGQSFSVNYKLPLKKIPILEWFDATTKYQADYDWLAGSKLAADSLGHLLANQRTFQVNSNLNFQKFYDQFPTLKKLNRSNRSRGNPNRRVQKPEEQEQNEDEDGKKKKQRDPNEPSLAAKMFLQPLTMLKRGSVNYQHNWSTELPGFMHTPRLLGQTFGNGVYAPGLDFTFGMQPDTSWLNESAYAGWISDNFCQTAPFTQTNNRTISGKASLEPFKDFKIDLDITKTWSESYSENFKVNEEGFFEHLFPRVTASFTVSALPIRTMYSRLDTNNISDTYKIFEENRAIISARLHELNPYSNLDYFNPIDSLFDERYKEGFGPLSQDVLIPAFLAAYNGVDANDIKLNKGLNPFPLPNWRISYSGLSKLKMFQKVFQTFKIEHGYASTYSVASFITDDDFVGEESDILEDFYNNAIIDSLSGNFVPYYNVPGITISEQLAPLFGIDMTLKNGLKFNVRYNKSRTLNLNFLAYELIEQRSQEIIAGFGFKLKGLTLPFKSQKTGEKIRLNNDINFKMDFSFRDNLTMNKGIDKDFGEETNGNKVIQIAPTIDYVVNDKIRVQLFYERTRTIPYTTRSFPSTRQRGGLRVSLSLTQ